MLNMVSDGVSSLVSGLAWIGVEIFALCLDDFGGRAGPRTKIVIIGGLRRSDMRCMHATCMACAC